MDDWRDNLVQGPLRIGEILRTARSVAVLGIKTAEQPDEPAYEVPLALQEAGYEVIPVPVRYPEAKEILGRPVFRSLAEVPQPIDVVQLFRRPEAVASHVEEILAAKPKVVWMQLGIRNDEAAERLARAGIKVVQDRCFAQELSKRGMLGPGRGAPLVP